jgi:N-dimethylarginine dimethylaminohydrolase
MNVYATIVQHPPRFLMCPPQYFAVSYSINPWMDPTAWSNGGAALHANAAQQWAALNAALRAAGAAIEIVRPEAGLPDLVFTANAAVVLDGKALIARFHHPQRQGEQPVFAAAFGALKRCGLIDEAVALPETVVLEGAGDCIFDTRRQLFWMGCGFRSDAAAAPLIEAHFGVPCVALTLTNPSFYHLDTAFCALPCGSLMYYPDAFSREALDAIHAQVAPQERVALDAEDAARFAANAVCVGRTLLLSSCSAALRRTLEDRGYAVIETPLTAFLRSGGSACCLTLRLDHQSRAATARAGALQVAAGQLR